MLLGFDVKNKNSGTSSLHTGPLSMRRELVELLESEPLFDYLTQNRVLNTTHKDQILSEKSPAKQNLLLLKHVDETGRKGLLLFLNALRLTGQHYLANHLDDGHKLGLFDGSCKNVFAFTRNSR